MYSIIVISAILACGSAAPAYLLHDDTHVIHTVPLTKSTYTQSSQVVDHGSTHVLHPVHTYHTVPVVHTKITKPVVLSHQVHAISVMPVHEVYHAPKTTITKSNQVVNHGSTSVVHAPLVPVVHTPVVYSSPVVTYKTVKTGDSAITHHSSTVHETVPVVKSVPVIAVHH